MCFGVKCSLRKYVETNAHMHTHIHIHIRAGARALSHAHTCTQIPLGKVEQAVTNGFPAIVMHVMSLHLENACVQVLAHHLNVPIGFSSPAPPRVPSSAAPFSLLRMHAAFLCADSVNVTDHKHKEQYKDQALRITQQGKDDALQKPPCAPHIATR